MLFCKGTEELFQQFMNFNPWKCTSSINYIVLLFYVVYFQAKNLSNATFVVADFLRGEISKFTSQDTKLSSLMLRWTLIPFQSTWTKTLYLRWAYHTPPLHWTPLQTPHLWSLVWWTDSCSRHLISRQDTRLGPIYRYRNHHPTLMTFDLQVPKGHQNQYRPLRKSQVHLDIVLRKVTGIVCLQLERIIWKCPTLSHRVHLVCQVQSYQCLVCR